MEDLLRKLSQPASLIIAIDNNEFVIMKFLIFLGLKSETQLEYLYVLV